jgi:hypothetical protein
MRTRGLRREREGESRRGEEEARVLDRRHYTVELVPCLLA